MPVWSQESGFVPDIQAQPETESLQGEHPLSELLQPSSPYLSIEQFTSPITGDSFNAQVLIKTPPVTSYDYDGCPHPVINSLAYTLVIDPLTGYVAYPSRFERKVKLSSEQLRGILGTPKFGHSSETGLPWDGAYAWEKFENAARLAAAAGAGKLAEANWWQQAGWAVRLDVIAGGNSFDSEVDEIFAELPAPRILGGDAQVPYELRLADYYQALRADGSFVDVSATRYALALAWLYRSRGELTACRKWLGEAQSADEGIASSSQLFGFLRSSVNLEEEYAGKAAAALEAAWQAGEPRSNERAAVAFQLAEISRRLGQRRRAALWYAEVEHSNRGEISRSQLSMLQDQAFGRGW